MGGNIVYHREPVVEWEGEFFRQPYLRQIKEVGEVPTCCQPLANEIIDRHGRNIKRLLFLWQARSLCDKERQDLEDLYKELIECEQANLQKNRASTVCPSGCHSIKIKPVEHHILGNGNKEELEIIITEM